MAVRGEYLSALPFGRGVRQVHRRRVGAKIETDEPTLREWSRNGVTIFNGDALDRYSKWDRPTVIVSDGAYGVKGFPTDPPTPDGLAGWYAPHIAAWSHLATAQTTLWFWNTEVGWATVHPVLKANGWTYRSAHVWNKGMNHAAGNSNTQTLRRLPVVTEVCVQYVRDAEFPGPEGTKLTMKEWLRSEWGRTGIPFTETNRAAGVINAATRKYFTKDHLWYYPPPEVFASFVRYANERGDPRGRPYFSLDGTHPATLDEWKQMRAKFYCEMGVTNVWDEPPLHGSERIKNGSRCAHLNQKPMKLIEMIVRLSSDPGDVVWEPFGGLCSTALAALRLGRRSFSAEINKAYYHLAVDRLARAVKKPTTKGLATF